MAFGKINALLVYGPKDVEIFKVGQKCAESGEPREIAEIRDLSTELPDGIILGYGLFDKSGDAIALFQDGTYATWFDRPEVKKNDK